MLTSLNSTQNRAYFARAVLKCSRTKPTAPSKLQPFPSLSTYHGTRTMCRGGLTQVTQSEERYQASAACKQETRAGASNASIERLLIFRHTQMTPSYLRRCFKSFCLLCLSHCFYFIRPIFLKTFRTLARQYTSSQSSESQA